MRTMSKPGGFNHDIERNWKGSPASSKSLRVRPAVEQDLPRLGELARELVTQHHHADPQRFFLPEGVEAAYRAWFAREMLRSEAVLLVADRGDATPVVGYLYGRFEDRNWNMLLERHAALHDVFVDVEARAGGAGTALIERFCALARERGLPRVVLYSAASNDGAQRLFSRLGFRPTMVEMTRDLPAPDASGSR